MKFLLDENFPLPLYHRLRSSGYNVEHVIVLGHRGLPDSVIIERLVREDLVFLTCDLSSCPRPPDCEARLSSRGSPQNLPIVRRVEIWFAALEAFRSQRPAGDIFELLDSGEIVPYGN